MDLTKAQMQIYNMSLFAGGSIANVCGSLFLNGQADVNTLKEKVNMLFELNDGLRVRLYENDGKIQQQIIPYKAKEIKVLYFSTYDEFCSYAVEYAKEPLSWQEELCEIPIVILPDRYGIMPKMHHLIGDAWAIALIGTQFNTLLSNGIPQTFSFADYIDKEKDYLNSNRHRRDVDFFDTRLKAFDNPVYISDKVSNNFTAERKTTIINKNFADKIKTFASQKNVSVFSVFLSVLSIYLYNIKIDSDCFCIGTTVLNRSGTEEKNTIGSFVNMVPVFVELDGSCNFLKNMENVENSILTTLRHQKYNYQFALENLRRDGVKIQKPYDVILSYQNTKIIGDFEESTWYHNGMQLESLQIHIEDRDNDGEFKIHYDYQTDKFSEKDIDLIHSHICNLLCEALRNPQKKIFDLEMLSANEKQRILYDFNDTAVEYTKDKCIHELFEEQAEKTPDKVAVVAIDKTLTYRELNEEANRIAHSLMEKGIGKGDIVGLMLPRKSYLLSALFGILKTGAAYLPIDSELPLERIKYMCKDTKAVLVISDKNIYSLLESGNISNPCTKMTNDSVCYCIYTSGSTGQPKGVMAMHRNVVNYISKNEHNISGKIITDDFETIVSISTCSFDIFVTETVLPLVNGLRTVLADEEQCRNQYALNKLIFKEKGEFLQTTPTKFKALTAEPSQRDFLKNVKAILLGGEAMETSHLQEFKKITNAKIYNIYGATEVPIWSTFADTDAFTDAITIGRPIANTQIYILDKHLKPVPIGVTGELCITGASVSAGYLNRPELTAEKFIDNPFGEGKLYRTGDKAYWREDGNIVFIGRSDFQVKIRGLRIELGEIESALQSVEGIDRAVVVVRKDKEDRQLICAFYTGEEKKAKALREEIGKSLPKYMVPHIFTHLEEMPMTSSGKVNRNALPEIELENISTETEYVAPGTEEEKILIDCIVDVLGAERVSILDNFFDIGGDSLKAIELTARIEEKGYTVPIKKIFSGKDIRELAEKLEAKEQEEESIEYGNVIPATAAQMRVYTAQMLVPDTTLYNVTYAFKSDSIDKTRLREAVNKLIERHESLRTHFENRDGVICQVIDESAEISVESIEDINTFTKPFDLGKSPLLRVGCNNDTVIISMHHITVDGESMPVFFRELNELYMGRELSGEAVQYGEFAVTDKYIEDNEKYWLNLFSDEKFGLNLPTDCQRGAVQSFKGSNIYEQIDISLHKRIEEKCKERGITPYVYYMACFSVFLSKLSGTEDIITGTPISGRQSRHLRAIGMFVNTIALRSRPEGNKKFSELLTEIRECSIEAIDNQNYPFGELVKKLGITASGRNPVYDVMLAYQSFEMTDISFADKKAELIPLSTEVSKCDMTFNILPRKDDVVLAIEYCSELFKEEKITGFAQMYVQLLEQCMDDSKYIKDISVTDMSLINSFNDTDSDYRKDKCIHELFEEQAEKTPDKIAVVAEDKTLTYRELNEEANRIAHALIEKGIGKGDIVGLMLPRKSCFMVALFGVLKTGAAYLPLDPDHPEERNRTILVDSNAKLCISEENFYGLLENYVAENPDSAVVPDDFCYCIYTSGSTGSPKGTLLYHRNLVWYMSVLKNLYGTENINMPFFTSQSVDLTVPSIYFPLITGGTVYMYNGELKNDLVSIFDNEKLNIIKFTPTHIGIVNKLVPAKSCPNIRCVIVGGESFYKDTCAQFLNKFGKHIEIHNEYGPTEATVSCTDFIVSPEDNTDGTYFSIGSPVNNAKIYITDNYLKPVAVGVTGELCIAGDGVGAGYLNNPELTAEKFIDNPFGKGKLYKTGDNAYWREDGSIVFAGRKDFQVKIRGLRIELGEIESAISGIDGINMSAAVVRSDAQDRALICAFYTGEKTEANQFRQILGERLPKYMIPHIFAHLEEMPLTVSGKIDRNALPEIELESISTETEYIAPKTVKEKALSDAVCSVMKLNSISMQENFFNAGGDSIKAIYIVSQLEELGYELHISDVMQKETFSEMAEAMKSISEKVIYVQDEVNGYIPFSPIMRTYLKENDTVSDDFVHTCTVSVDCDEETAVKALDVLVSHHDILRGTVCEKGIIVHFSKDSDVYSTERITAADADSLRKYFEEKTLHEKPVHITFCNTDEGNFISISIHHFLVDLVSWEILIRDFMTVVEQLKNKEPISLPAKTASFKLWNEELQKYAESISEESKLYWKSVDEKLDNVKVFSEEKTDSEKTEKISFVLDKSLTGKLLNDTNYKYGTKPNEVLLTALGLAAAEMAEGSVGIIIEGHGRAELNKPIAIDRTVGWFTVCYPVVIDNNSNITDELINIKETLRRIPRGGVDYLLLSQEFHKNAEIKFNFYQADKDEKSRLVGFNSNGSVFRNRINVDCSVTEGILSVSISVPRWKYEAKFGERLGMVFREYIEKLVAACTENDIIIKTRSDFSDDELTESELDELKDLFDWTDGYEQ